MKDEMEEKLYFRPANYGKGIKKKDKPEKSNKTEKGEKSHRARNLILFLVLIVIIVLVILWLLRGKTTTHGQYPENIKNESLSCVSTTAVYEKISVANSNDKELKLNLVFYGKEKLSSIGLKYTLNFATNDEAYSAEAFSQAQLKGNLQDYGRSHSSFNNKFSLMGNVLVLTLYAEASDIDVFSRGYFLIKNDNPPNTLDEYRSNYESQGFTCESSTDNN